MAAIPIGKGEIVWLHWAGSGGTSRVTLLESSPDRVELGLGLQRDWLGAAADPGEPVRLVWERSGQAWMQEAIVDGWIGGRRMIARLVSIPPAPLQRREFFRMRVAFSLLLPGPRRRDADYRIFLVDELSAGGGRCVAGDPSLTAGSQHRGFIRPRDGEGPLPIRFEVLRRERIDGIDTAAFRFLELSEDDRARLLRALFHQYRIERRERRESS